VGDYITKVVFRYILLIVMLYGVYIIAHGHLSPGGGFAGGMIMGLGFLLYLFIFGAEAKVKMRRHLMNVVTIMVVVGSVMEGMKFLIAKEHGPVGTPGTLFSVGLISIANLGIGIMVAGTVISIFYLLVEGEF
jgi:multicomponent Na+:H+ antiporter subunit B